MPRFTRGDHVRIHGVAELEGQVGKVAYAGTTRSTDPDGVGPLAEPDGYYVRVDGRPQPLHLVHPDNLQLDASPTAGPLATPTAS